ncbi:hypothetical protein [Coleofasciculus sp.]|uniref:hypothetical protein n=1 Tax=Coleofasciculus sp. TaxID=3100458 RepID=UPI003A1F6E84
MPYEYIQCFGFCIQTDTAYNPDLASDTKEAIAIRIRALVKAASIIQEDFYSRIQWPGSSQPEWSKTLKILVAPEFFYRPPGNGGAYQFNDEFKYTVQQAFSGFGWQELSDWLIVAGTIISKQQSNIPNQWVGHNTAIIVRGGQRACDLIEKQFVSTRDGMEKYIHGNYEAALGNIDVAQYMQSTQPIVFDVDGIHIGVEICLDHFSGVLRNRGQQAHIHLITACGMPIQWNNVIAPLVFRVDGQYKLQAGLANFAIRNQFGLRWLNYAHVDYNNKFQSHLITKLNRDNKKVTLAAFPIVKL